MCSRVRCIVKCFVSCATSVRDANEMLWGTLHLTSLILAKVSFIVWLHEEIKSIIFDFDVYGKDWLVFCVAYTKCVATFMAR